MLLKGKTAIVTGSSRGIGRAIALKLAQLGANLVITGKTVTPHPKLEGTLYTVADEVRALGAEVLVVPMDVRDETSVHVMVRETVNTFNGIDILINNASAIFVGTAQATPLKKFDLMMAVNVRGTLACSTACIPYLRKAENPHILTLSPPLSMNPRWFKDHVPYTISKYGMSMLTLGLSQELLDDHIAVNSLWPKTFIATAAIWNNFPIELLKHCRHPEIVADAAVGIVQEKSDQVTGQFFIDEQFLSSKGITDFDVYAINPSEVLYQDLFLD